MINVMVLEGIELFELSAIEIRISQLIFFLGDKAQETRMQK